MKDNTTTKVSTWGEVFENVNMILLNEYPYLAPEELDMFEDTNDIFQWYILGDSYIAERIKETCHSIAEDIKYSERLGNYMLAVRHFGTPWESVKLEVAER